MLHQQMTNKVTMELTISLLEITGLLTLFMLKLKTLPIILISFTLLLKLNRMLEISALKLKIPLLKLDMNKKMKRKLKR